eukprot:m.325948 g.325948  ORF g.325948 m.325948 type:complete len:56 (-) comp27658_c2_seq4:2950-3117(-)
MLLEVVGMLDVWVWMDVLKVPFRFGVIVGGSGWVGGWVDGQVCTAWSGSTRRLRV